MKIRYETHRECERPCEKMHIWASFNYKMKTGEFKSQAIPTSTHPCSGGMYQDDRIKLMYVREVEVTEELFTFTLSSMFGEVGGCLGMLLGISLMDLEVLTKYVAMRWRK